MLTNNHFRILQNNLHKSKERTHSILNDPDMKDYAILLLQEQYWSPYTKSSPTHHAWTLVEPTIPNKTPRTAIYINNNFLTASQVTPMELPFSDATAITINTKDTKPSLLINVYNPCDNSILTNLHDHLCTNINIME